MEKALLFIVAALGLSTVVNLVLKRLNLSLIIGYIFTGVFITQAFDLEKYTTSHTLEALGEFGIVFLMFTIGLEMSLSKMNKLKSIIFLNGFLQIGVNTAIFYAIIYFFFDLSGIASLIIALSFALSSTAIVLSFLKSTKEIYTPYGQRAMGILIFQDLAVIPILILLGILANESGASLETILLETLESAVIVIGLLFVVGKRLFTWLLHFSANADNDELFMSSVLFIVIAASFIAHIFGFTYSLGAFVAGMLIAETKYYHKVESDIAPFKDILLGTFFILIGMKIDLNLFVENFLFIIEIFVTIMVIKTLFTALALFFHTKKDVAFKTAFATAQVGEFALVIFTIAMTNRLIDPALGKMVMLITIFSMVVAPFLIPYTNKFVALLFKDTTYLEEVSDIGEVRDHIIICGYSEVGQNVQKHLEMYGFEYVIVDNNPKLIKQALKEGHRAYLGDMSKTNIIEALHAQDAAAIIITLENPDIKHLVCQRILRIDKNANIIVQIASKEERKKLRDELEILNVVDGEVETARILVERVMQCQLSLHK